MKGRVLNYRNLYEIKEAFRWLRNARETIKVRLPCVVMNDNEKGKK